MTETPKADDTAFARSQWLTLLDSRSLAQAAQARAAALGWESTIEECDELPAAEAAERLLARLRRDETPRPAGCVWSQPAR